MKDAKGNQLETATLGFRCKGNAVGAGASLRQPRQETNVCTWADNFAQDQTTIRQTKEEVIAV
jgi:hypothetical protein